MDEHKIASRCKAFAANLKILIDEWRQAHNITQRRISDVLGIKTRTLNNYLNGKSLPNLDSILRLCDYFGVSFDWMTGESELRTADMQSEGLSLGLSDRALSNLRALNSGRVPYKKKPLGFNP